MKKRTFLYSLLMAIVMMAMSPQRMWAAGTEPTETVEKDGITYYKITSADELFWFKEKAEASSSSAKVYGILGNDITINANLLTTIADANADRSTLRNWEYVSGKTFNGILDGDGHSIKGLYIYKKSTSYIAMFNTLASGSKICNLNIEDSYLEGSSYLAFIVINNSGTIENCSVSGLIKSSSYSAGFVSTNNSTGVITRCISNIEIPSGGWDAGFVSTNNGTIDQCISNAVLSAGWGAGIVDSNSGKVSNCIISANLKGSNSAGVVYNSQVTQIIENCYFNGTLNNSTSCSPIMRVDAAAGSVTNCYYLSTSIGTSNKVGYSTSVESNDVENGYLCYNLNNGATEGTQVWYQTISSDAHPVLDNTHSTVYAATVRCDGTALTFTNTATTPTPPAHELQDVARVDADEVNHTDGNIAYKHCSVCDKNFDDSNNELAAEDIILHPFDANGVCTDATHTSPAYQKAVLNGTVYEISNAGQLAWFRDFVNSAEKNITANAKLIYDIDLTPVCSSTIGSWTPIAPYEKYANKGYQGTFDGNNKQISNLYLKSMSGQRWGLFSVLGKNSEVKDLKLHGTITTNSNVNGILAGMTSDCKQIQNVRTSGLLTCKGSCTGGIVGEVNGSAVETEIKGCLNEAYITGTCSVGGIVGKCSGSKIKFINCGNTGTIKATSNSTYEGNGGIAGRMQCTQIENCYSSGTVIAENDPSHITGVLFGYLYTGLPTNNATGLYYVAVDGYNAIGGAFSSYYEDKYPSTEVTTTDVTIGNLAYMLQGSNSDVIWGQNLANTPADAYPIPGGAKVYPVRKNCAGKYDTFSNTEASQIEEITQHTLTDVAAVPSENNLDGTKAYKHCSVCGNDYDADGTLVSAEDLLDHSFDENGICTHTHETPAYQKATAIYKQDNTLDYYEISNAGQLAWFSNYINASSDNLSTNAKLANDIDLNPVCHPASDGVTELSWTPIASQQVYGTSNGYTGTFDGRGFKISNLYINTTKAGAGLFGTLFTGAEVKDIKVHGSVTSSASYVSLLASYAKDVAKISKIITSGSINGSGSNSNEIGGIVGYATISASGEITECLNEATITGKNEVGGLFGYINANSVTMNNCGNVGSITSTGTTSSCYVGGLFGNCYYLNKLTNSYNTGTVTAANATKGVITGYALGLNNGCENVYYYTTVINMPVVGQLWVASDYYKKQWVNPISITESSDITSGKLAYLLQGKQETVAWGQTIGNADVSLNDAYPIPGAAPVYAKTSNCNGSPKEGSSFTNDISTVSRDTHSYDETTHICSVCNAYDFTQAMTVSGVTVGVASNDYPWTGNTENTTFTGGLMSTNKGVGSSTSKTVLTFTAQEDFNLKFDYAVNTSSSAYGTMTITVDGEKIANAICNTASGTYNETLAAGSHVLSFEYSKNWSSVSGLDRGFIYNIVAKIPDCDHSMNTNSPIEQVVANCAHGGYDKYVCSKCGTTFKKNEVAANNNHDYSAHTLSATADADGCYSYVCANGCGTPSTDKIMKDFISEGQNLNVTKQADGGFTTAGDVTIADATAYSSSINLTVTGTLTYTRTVSEALVGKSNALYVPFAMSYSDWSTSADIYKILNIFEEDTDDDGKIDVCVLKVVKLGSGDKTKANTPYIIRPKSTDLSITLSDVTLVPAQSKSISCSSTDYEFTFTGTYAQKPIDADSYYFMGTTGGLNYSSAATTLGAQRWYMGVKDKETGSAVNPSVFTQSTNNAAKQIVIVADDEEITGINNVNANANDETVYNISGQRLNSTKRGINIINGRKVMVK